MIIELKSLHLENFKGIKSLSVDFEQVTSICGDNATGKTTLMDAFTWLLFGKDGRDNKDFNIKTLDAFGQAIPQIDHSVEGILYIDEQETTLRRTYREKWIRRRGSEESELTGHETLFYWNEVPLLAGEYKSKIDALVDEVLFKLLTSTMVFNSMKWQDRREVLIRIAGDIGNADIVKAMKKDQVNDITEILNSGKPMEEYRKEIAMRKKKLDNDLELIPSRIDEVQRGMPESRDFALVEKDIAEHEANLKEIENTISDQVAAYKEQGDEIQEVQSQIFDLKKKQQAMEFEISSKASQSGSDVEMKRNSLSNQIAQTHSKLKDEENNLIQFTEAKERTEKAIDQLRKEWTEASKLTCVIDEDFVCPTCKRVLDPETIESKTKEIQDNFEKHKSEKLSEIKDLGNHRRTTISRIDADIKSAEDTIVQLKKDIEEIEKELSEIKIPEQPKGENPEITKIKQQITTLELQILEVPKLDVEGLKQQRASIQSRLDNLKMSLGAKDVIARAEKRINELLEEERTLAQQISDLERQEFTIDGYIRSKMDMVEVRVNEKFELVRFKMFNVLLNGGIEECCETTLDGVPYADMNSAGRIQAGVDIINTLSEHYGIWCPIWIDNRESTNQIPQTKSQLVNLVVTRDKKLIIK